MTHQRNRFGMIAGVVMHLPAAGLGGAEFHRVAQTFEHAHHRLAGLGEERVVIAGDEERDQHTYWRKRTYCAFHCSVSRGSYRSVGKDRSMTARASARESTAPVASICIAMLPSAVA